MSLRAVDSDSEYLIWKRASASKNYQAENEAMKQWK